VTNVYRRRQVVFYEDHPAHGVYLVCAGRVKVYKADRKGHQLTVRVAGAGELLGYRDLLASEPYAATAEALDDATLAYVDGARFKAFLAQQPALAARMFAELAKDVRFAEDKARDMALKSSRERLAGQLLTVQAAHAAKAKPGGGLRLPYTRQDLAELAGLAQETVIRLLTEMEERKVITLDGRDLTIVNGRALERLAGTAA
jgi:CRP-like cAMP-binding protein